MFGKVIRIFVLALFLASFSQQALTASIELLENTTFLRAKGKPKIETVQFSSQPAERFEINVFNGGVSNQYCRISSAVISLNNQVVFSPSDFNSNVYHLAADVQLQAENNLSVELRSQPGCGIELNVVGESDTPELEITSTPPIEAVVGQTYYYQLATNPELDWANAAVNILSSPNGMSVSNGLIQWTPTSQQVGEQAISLEVSHADYATATQSYQLNTVIINQAPAAQDLAIELVEDDIANFSLEANDPQNDPIEYTLVTQPEHGSLQVDGLQIIYRPTTDFNGIDSFIYQANDGQLSSNEATVTLTVVSVNDKPQILSEPLLASLENVIYSYKIEAIDVDDDSLTYELVEFPNGMTIDNEVVSWLPNSSHLGEHNIIVKVTDTQGLFETQSFNLTVNNVNDKPFITSSPLTSINENEVYQYTVIASDPDLNDSLLFSLDVAPAGMNIVSETGVISWTIEASQVGSHEVTVSVTDADGLSDTQEFTLMVVGVAEPPVITSLPITSAIVATSYLYDVEATDPDNEETLSYMLVQAPEGMSIDPNSGLVEWIASEAGSYTVSIRATNSQNLFDEQIYQLNIVNALPPVTSKGKHFKLMFNINHYIGFSDLLLYVSSEKNTSATLTIPGLNYEQEINVIANQVTTIDLTDKSTDLIFLGTGVQNNAIFIDSEEDVVVYLMNKQQSTTDAALVLPVAALEKEYIVTTYTDKLNSEGSFFGIVATEDNTIIEITSSVSFNTNNPYQITLNKGQAYQGFNVYDLSGTHILADKKIAVFAGNKCTAVKANFCDHLVEQLPPIISWGSEYYTVPLATRKKGDTFRIYASKDDTYVQINGEYVAKLDKFKYHDEIIEGPSVIKTTYPTLVAQYSHGADYDKEERETLDNQADPFMLLVPPAEQYISQYIVTSPAEGINNNYINILAPTDKLDEIKIDQIAVDSNGWIEIGESGYSGKSINVEIGVHIISSVVPIGVYMYGYDSYESYGYLGGMALSELTNVDSLTMSTTNISPTAGDEVCVIANLKDFNAKPIAQTQVEFELSSDEDSAYESSRFYSDLSDLEGNAHFCYTKAKESTDTIKATTREQSNQLELNWQMYSGSENLKPTINSLPNSHATPTETYEYQVIAYDPNGDSLTYELTEKAEGMSINADSGLITWSTPNRFNLAVVEVKVSDSDGLFDIQKYRLNATPGANRFPEINSVAVTAAIEKHPYTYYVKASDLDADPLNTTLLTFPTGMTISNDGLISWTPTEDQIGTHYVSLEVTDGRGGIDNQDYYIEVTPNSIPVITSSPVIETTARHPYYYGLAVTDGDGDYITYSLSESPEGMTIAGRNVQWTPTDEQIGTHQVTIIAKDRYDGQASQAYQITVKGNSAPLFVTEPVTTASTGHNYYYYANATDPDNDAISYRKLVGPEALTVASYGTATWIPTLADIGLHQIIIEADDGKGKTATQTYMLEVKANAVPVITSTPVTIAHGFHNYYYGVNGVTATDGDNDNLSYSLKSGPEGLTMSYRYLQWTPTNEQVGMHQVVIQVDDSKGGVATQSYQISVAKNTPPKIISNPIFSGSVDNYYRYSTQAIDSEGDQVRFSLIDSPPGMTISTFGGDLNWKPASDQAGVHLVTVEAKDNYGAYSRQGYQLTILDGDLKIVNSPNNPTIFHEQDYLFNIEAAHFNQLPITYELQETADGVVFNPITGEGSWRPAEAQIGSHNFSVRAFSTDGLEDTVSFTINVERNANNPPSITSQPELLTLVNEQYAYLVVATDPDEHEITYSLVQKPQDMSINIHSGIVSWLPGESNVGEHQIVVRATDEREMFDEQSFTLVVEYPNRTPVINSEPVQFAKVGFEYNYQVEATDQDDNILTYELIESPEGMEINAAGLITWEPQESEVILVRLKVSDEESFVEQQYSLAVSDGDVNLAGQIEVTPKFVNAGENSVIKVYPKNTTGSVVVTISVDDIELEVNSNFETTFASEVVGQHNIQVEISDLYGSISLQDSVWVKDPNDTTAPVIEIISPVAEAQETIVKVSAPTEIIATVNDDNLASWKLLYTERGSAPDEFVVMAEGNANVTEQALATFDPSMLLNGQYVIVLVATDINGNVSQNSVDLIVKGDLKVGNFSITFEDLAVPISGIPVVVTRTYDTRQKHKDLDFGYGWSIGYQNVKVEESRVQGKFWSLNQYPSGPLGLIPLWCVEPQGAPVVTVTLPNGDVESFDTQVSPKCNENVPLVDVQLEYVATDGTDSSLVAMNDVSARLVENTLVEMAYFESPVDPSMYQLTTRSGYVYHLDQNFGITQVDDPNGHSITYSDSGIEHSAGKRIDFVRNELGQITQVIDPKGNAINYAYDESGNLHSVINAEAATVTHTYNSSHGLLDIIDPLGRSIVKNIYDDTGRLIAQEDNEGNRTDFNHDLAGRQSIVTDRLNRTTTLYYDDQGNVASQVDALGNVTQFTFDENGNQLTKIDALNRTTSATYNEQNDQLTQTDALGNSVSFMYNQRGQELTITDESGDVFTNTYDAVGNLLSIKDPQGNIVGNNINAQGLPSLVRDAMGNETTYSYDTDGNKLTETNPLGEVTHYSYDTNNNVLSESHTRTLADNSSVNEVTHYEYDKQNRLIKTTDPLGHVYRSEYDLVGNQVASIDAKGDRTETVYDAYGRVTAITYPDNSTESKTYDAEGNLLSETDRLGNATSYQYDALNRLTKTTFADNSITETQYDAVSQVIATIDALDNRIEYEYDLNGRRIKTTDALGNVHRFGYDVDGNLISEIDANGQTTTYSYDELDRKTQTTFANSSNLKTGFDALARKTSATDQADVVTNYAYDALGRLISVTDVAGNVTSYTYDEAGNKLTQTDAEGRTTSWTYDALGRVLTRTLPLGQVETSTYDAFGNLFTHVDFNGELTIYTYDINNRVTQIVYAKDNSVESFTYDNVGNRLTSSNVNGTWSYTYDAMNRLASETKPSGEKLEYAYDLNGNKTQLKVTYVDGSTRIENSTYDAMNRLETVTDADGNKTTYGYDAVGNRISVIHSNANMTSYVYDELNRLTQLQDKHSDDSVYQQFDYTLHITGRRLKIEELSGRVSDYVYDNLYRLTNESITDFVNGNYTAEYQFDKVGNRIYSTINGVSTAYTYDANDRLIQEGGEVYTYDAMGNTLTKTIDSDITTYTYDAKQKLIAASILQSGELTENNYRYNVDGIRTQKVEQGVITNYLVDNNQSYAQVIAETDASAVVTVEYIFGDDLLSQKRFPSPLQGEGQGEGGNFNYQYDGLGSTRSLTDSTGNVSDEYFYDAFGVELARTGSTENDYLFAGEQFDRSLNNYYLRARYYDQGIGRFTQQDTWMGRSHDPVTLHKYLYAGNDPVNGIDPSGNMTMMEFGAAFTISSVLLVAATNTRNPFTSRFNNTSTWDDDDWLNPSVTGILILAAMANSVHMLEKIKEKVNDDGEANYEFYHGTNGKTALYLANGGNISIDEVANNINWSTSSGGFYMADNYDDAWHFGQMHTNSGSGFAVVQYEFSNFAHKTLVGVGMKTSPLPQAPRFFPQGNEIVVPTNAFGLFNTLKNTGEITPSLHPDFRR